MSLGTPQIFFGRCEHWDEEEGWQSVEARDVEEASVKFAEKWQVDDGEKFSIVKAEGGHHAFIAQKRLVVRPRRAEDDEEDKEFDSQR